MILIAATHSKFSVEVEVGVSSLNYPFLDCLTSSPAGAPNRRAYEAQIVRLPTRR